MNPRNTSGHEGISAIMSNPKLQKIMSDAIDAPIGSTKRSRAHKIISIVNKANPQNKYSGMGGPGDMGINSGMFSGSLFGNSSSTQPSATPWLNQTGTDSAKKIIFPALPAIKTGDASDSSSNPFSWMGGASSGAPAFNQTVYGNPFGVSGVQKNAQGFYSTPIPKAGQTTAPVSGPTQAPGASTVPVVPIIPQTGTQTSTGTNAEDTTKTGTQTPPPQQYPDLSSIFGSTPTPSVNLGSSYPNLNSSLNSALKNGTGAAGFAYGAMGDINTVKEFSPGTVQMLRQMYPGVPDDKLPWGANLTQQVSNLADVIKKDYHLDTLLNQKISLENQGPALTSNLQDFIRGKDEQVNNIQGMIDNAKSQMKDMDWSNPRITQTMGSYMNYLYTLKGRANARYIDFMNGSINQYNAQLNQVTNNYNTELTAAEDKIKTMATITQDDYNRMFTTLSDMYNNAEQAPAKALAMDIQRYNLKVAQSQLLSAASGSGEYDSEIAKKWNGISKYLEDKDGNIRPDANIGEHNEDPVALASYVQDRMSNEFSQIASDPAKASDAFKRTDFFSNQILNYAQKQNQPEQARKMAEILAQKSGDAMNQYILQHASDLKSALKSLLSPSSGWFSGAKTPDNVTFVNDNKDRLDEKLLGMAYDFYDTNKESYPEAARKNIFSAPGKSIDEVSDEDFSKKTSGILSSFLGNSLINAIYSK